MAAFFEGCGSLVAFRLFVPQGQRRRNITSRTGPFRLVPYHAFVKPKLLRLTLDSPTTHPLPPLHRHNSGLHPDAHPTLTLRSLCTLYPLVMTPYLHDALAIESTPPEHPEKLAGASFGGPRLGRP